ncbi:ph-response regulator protein palc [Moniliophthora roreri MCA 2997]|uniref:pH-response regulator protein palC n=1 Tax=Moniliophthora roreri (strain MCA 2997) TaxID=1381753 RepID=V2X9B0_MONRO|nr:ph-response regulator protein palc [Moniliophthora roreri MCA 2997]
MSTYLYELPTTGAVSFSDFVLDQSSNRAYTRHISDITQTRANLRGILKESKRTDGEKDYLTLVKTLDEYLPKLLGIMGCVAHDEIGSKTEPSFSWRTTLSAHVFNSSPRLSLPSLHAEYASSLLTYAFALSNLARTIVASLGPYERDRHITKEDRESKDERLKHAADFLARASGIFTFISETVLVEWENSRDAPGSKAKFSRPPDLSKEVNTALAKLSLADAQTLFIRKLLSKSAYESNIAPGPPLPKSHPSPALLAKLHLECANLYSSARLLAKTPSGGIGEVAPELRHYLGDEAALHSALAKKWLAIDAGEKGGTEKGGDAVGFMIWAQKELSDLKDGGKSGGVGNINMGDKEKKGRSLRKDRVAEELASVGVWLKHYKKVNDTLHFQPVPSQSDLQARMPTGILAVSAKAYTPPTPAFGPGSPEYVRRQAEELDASSLAIESGESSVDSPKDSLPSSGTGTYAGAGSYF